MKTNKTVLITDKEHEFYNQRLEGFCAYYDLYHTGNGPDLYIAKTPEDVEIRLLSDQIDTKDYECQDRKEIIEKLGVDVGDIVMISRLGSGSFSSKFDLSQPHLITEISSSGYVIFDGGQANGFRPDMSLYNGDLPVQTDFTKPATNNGMPF